MGYSFPGVSTAQVASILSTIDVDSAPQARSAFAALQKFPTMHSLQFDPAIRAMRQRWNQSTPKYTVFWSGEALVARLLGQPLDWSSRFQLRSRLIIVLRLFQLYRSFDCANMVRLWGNIEDQWFMPTRRKGWSTLRWDRILRLQGLDHMCPFSLLTAYINVTTEGASSDGSPGPVFLAVTRPFSPLSPARISSLTKEILQDAGVDADFFGAHSTRGAGLDLLRQFGLSAEQSAEVGSWANLTAFNSHYSRLGAKDFLAKALQSRLSSVHSPSSSWCSGPYPSRTPSSNRDEGGREEEGTEHQEVEPTPPAQEPAVGSGEVRPPAAIMRTSGEPGPSNPPRPAMPIVRGWRKNPPRGKRPADTVLESRPKRRTVTASGRVCTQFVHD